MTRLGLVPWPAWFDGAPCAGLSDVFFPDDPTDTGAAVAVCHSCPFNEACRAWGVSHVGLDWDGIYGGLTLRERRIEARFGRGDMGSCSNGHEYTTENIRWDVNGNRRCLTCRRAQYSKGAEKARLRRAS